MSHEEVRPFPPAPPAVVVRSALFALANLGAEIRVFDEERGVVVGLLKQWRGLRKQEVSAMVEQAGALAILKLACPTPQLSNEVLRRVSAYVVDGSRLESDAAVQAARDREKSLQQEKRRALSQQAQPLHANARAGYGRRPTSGETGHALTPAPAQPALPVVRDSGNRIIHIPHDPETFANRTAFLTTCEGCHATLIKGSLFCSCCGRPLTLEAVRPELRQSLGKACGTSRFSAVAGLLFNAVPLAVLGPLFLNAARSQSAQAVLATPPRPTLVQTLVVGLAGALPMFCLGLRAVNHAARATWLFNVESSYADRFNKQAGLGRALGWIDCLLAVSWLAATVTLHLVLKGG